MFTSAKGTGRALTAVLLASCLATLVENRSTLLEPVRSVLWTIASPLHFAAQFAHGVGELASGAFANHAEARRENAALRRELVKLRGLLTRHDAVLRENARLRELYESRERVREDTLVAELVGVSENPIRITIDKGHLREVRVGHAVTDSQGLLGQVVESSALTSRVLLITDSSHSVPVRVLRNDVRAIAAGEGEDGLVLKDIPSTLDVRQGDRLVTSGLGGRFPPGYPVGEVTAIVQAPGELFATATVRPTAAIDRSRQVLVVLTPQDEASVEAALDEAGLGT